MRPLWLLTNEPIGRVELHLKIVYDDPVCADEAVEKLPRLLRLGAWPLKSPANAEAAAHRPTVSYQPSGARVEHAVQELIGVVRSSRAWGRAFTDDDTHDEPDTWNPGKQARARMRFLAEVVLREDNRWRSEHDPEEW